MSAAASAHERYEDQRAHNRHHDGTDAAELAGKKSGLLLRRVRSLDAKIKAVAVTAFADSEDRVRAL